jgi:seryl-tRNA(Sec) selenium transferase
MVIVPDASRTPDALARRLRMGATPVVARIAEGKLWLDLRTVLPEQDAALAEAVVVAYGFRG